MGTNRFPFVLGQKKSHAPFSRVDIEMIEPEIREDFFELAMVMCRDALERRESCGGHFREEFQYPDGEAKRDELDPDGIAAPEPADDLLALNDALDLLAAKDPQKAELVKLRYFAGLTADEVANVLGISPSTADRQWHYARAWLKRAMGGGG